MSSPYSRNVEYSRNLQEKYEYYQAGLNFTLLAASIQTAEFGTDKVHTSLELIGWLLLMLSGVIALLRFRMQPVAHRAIAHIQRKKEALEQYREGHSKGHREVHFQEENETVPIEQAILEVQRSIEKAEPEFKALEKRLIKQQRWHLWLFICGFAFVVLSRAYAPLLSIFCA